MKWLGIIWAGALAAACNDAKTPTPPAADMAPTQQATDPAQAKAVPVPPPDAAPVVSDAAMPDAATPVAAARDDLPPSDAEIEAAIRNTRIHLLTADGDEGRYKRDDSADQGADLAKSIAHAKGAGPASTASATIRSLVKLGSIEGSASSLSADEVARRIRSRYLAGIKRCHERVLKDKPTAGGRVDMGFTVGLTGKVGKVQVDGFDKSMNACVTTLLSSWRFPPPKDSGGNPTTATFSVPMVLKPAS